MESSTARPETGRKPLEGLRCDSQDWGAPPCRDCFQLTWWAAVIDAGLITTRG
jgi:hypothetical protein